MYVLLLKHILYNNVCNNVTLYNKHNIYNIYTYIERERERVILNNNNNNSKSI